MNRRAFWSLAVPILCVLQGLVRPGPAVGGVNAGGVLLVHCNPAMEVPGEATFVDGGLAACDSAVVQAPADSTVLWFIYAAFPSGSSPRLKVVTFGCQFDADSVGILWAAPRPGSSELRYEPTAYWPYPGSGTMMGFTEALTDSVDEIYCFAGYGPEGENFALVANPDSVQGGVFADDGTPSELDAIADFGSLGFGVAGALACPQPADTSGEQNSASQQGEGEPAPEEGDDGDQGSESVPLTNEVEVYLDPAAIQFDSQETAALPLTSVTFVPAELRDSLQALGVATIRKSYPGSLLADSVAYNGRGELVHLPDISSFYVAKLATPEAALQALPVMARIPQIQVATVVPEANGHTAANDPYYDSWQWISHDAQWHLRNGGGRTTDEPNAPCDTAQAGYDIHAEAAWAHTYGDSTITIGMVDTGIFGGTLGAPKHEDLPVIPLTSEERQRIQVHPDIEWCDGHGGTMAGLAGARTNNGRGVAGVCGNCSLLDIEVSGCSTTACQTHSDSCQSIDRDWRTKMDNAFGLSLPDGKRLRIINMEVVDEGGSSPAAVTLSWRRYLLDAVFVAPSKDNNTTSQPNVHTITPANLPFVLGVGGSTWRGLFWEYATSCYDSPDNGTTIGPSDFPINLGHGSIVDLCAPASGKMVTTVNDSRGYYTTTGQCSGASAMVSGAAALVMSAWSGYEEPSADDVVGILVASADPFAESPDAPASYTRACTSCPRAFYGNGILNAEDAVTLAEDYNSYYVPTVRIASRYSNIIPGTWHYDEVYREAPFGGDSTYVQYRVSAQIQTSGPFHGARSAVYLKRLGWARPSAATTNTFAACSREVWQRIFLARQGVRDCHMGPIDPGTGRAWISGYDYAVFPRGHEEAIHYLVGQDQVRMTYVVPEIPVSTGVEDRNCAVLPAIAVGAPTNPVRGACDIQFTARTAGDLRADVVDVSGRVVQTLINGHVAGGRYRLTWEARSGDGARAAAGVYWIRFVMNGHREAKRIVVVR
jgi:hypothetical protein